MEDEKRIAELFEQLGFGEPKRIERLGGLTNRSYRVLSDARDVAVRLPGDGTEGLVNRADERIINQIASDIEVDSLLYWFDAETGEKVTQWIPYAETIHVETAHDPENMEGMADALRRLHESAQEVSVVFDPFEKVGEYERLILSEGGRFWDDYEEVKERVLRALAPYAGDASSRRLCHCDPLCENFVKDAESGRMYLLDWEYAGMNDPMWDVADVVVESGFADAEQRAFARAYFRREPSAEEMSRITANVVLIDFLWSLWGKQRSAFDESLTSYGDERFARCKKNLEALEARMAAGV